VKWPRISHEGLDWSGPVLSRSWWKFEGGVISGVTDPTRPAAATVHRDPHAGA
jgi:hypothetical protein